MSGHNKAPALEATSSINVSQQGQSVEARVQLSGTGNASLTVQTQTTTTTEVLNHVGDTQPDTQNAREDRDDLEKHLEKLIDDECAKDAQAMQPVLQDAAVEPEKSVPAEAEADADSGDVSKLEALQSMIQSMLKRPGTIDINQVMAEATSLQAKAAPARRRISTKSAPEQSKSAEQSSVTPEKTAQEQSSVAPEKAAQEQSSVAPEKAAQKQSSVAAEKTAPEQSSVAPEKAAEKQSSVAAEKAAEKQSSVAAEKTASEQSSSGMPPPVGPPKRKASREEETEDEKLAREAHNKYMRSAQCPPEVAAKAFDAQGKSRGSSVMRFMFEQFITADENWQQSAIMMNIRQKKKGSRHGKFVWKRFDHVVTEHGEAIAKDMLQNKKKDDPNLSGKWVQKHPDQPEREDWMLMKCFDSKVENEESESETEFELGQEAIRFGRQGRFRRPWAAIEAWNLLKGSMVKVTEADGLKVKLQASGMGAQFVDALMADSSETVQLLKGTYHTLKEAISANASDDEKKFCCNELTAALKQFDSKMKAIRKAMPSNNPPKATTKATAKAKGRAAK
ncbi:unnamed protein product [Symbiodinium sp. CCMP2592]|nr:unnamed protein product [Symbiodinium sp. CCMP2592]